MSQLVGSLVGSSIQHSTGVWYFACNAQGLAHVSNRPLIDIAELDDHPLVKPHAKALANMLDGITKKYALPMVFDGTDFQKKVWKKIAAIGYGQTKSYKQIAQELGGNATRAVGTACGANPLPIAIPCHRVIRTDGGLGGFGAGGLGLKTILLDFERRNSQKVAA